MSAIGGRLHLRLFLEGVEVPVVSASIQSQKNAAAAASLQLPANDYLLDLKPRTLVHLYAYDSYRGAPVEQQVWVQGAGISKKAPEKDPDARGIIPESGIAAPDRALAAIDLENENYKLIFGGEVIGVHYTKSPSSRGMTLQCVDWSSYWDIAYQYQVSGMALLGGNTKAAFSGASSTVFNDLFEGSGDIVLKLLSTPPRTYPKMKGSLLAGIMHLIESIGGCYFGDKAVRGTNDFFSIAEMRLHLTQMVGANPESFEDEKRLLRANGFGSLFSKALGGLGKMVTIRQVLLALQRYIFHEVVPITAPRFVPSPVAPGGAQAETVSLAQDAGARPLLDAAESLRKAALELRSRQEGAANLTAARKNSAARGGLKKELGKLSEVAEAAHKKTRAMHIGSGVALNAGGLVQVATAFATAARQFASVLDACLVGATKDHTFPLADTTAATGILYNLDAIAASMQRVGDATYPKPVHRVGSQPDPPPRLYTQIYRPDVWMVAPPRCNVIFPELYSSFSYGRNFMGEVTRLLLRTHEAFYGSDILFDGFYMAPSKLLGKRTGKKIAGGRGGIEPPDLSDAPLWIVRDMLDHELYTGITPTFERMSDLNLHAIRGGTIVINEAKVGYAQLACNHIFNQYRFKARELMCSGKFNPYAVLGFPMVVIDRYSAEDIIREGTHDFAYKLAKETLPISADQQNVKEIQVATVQQIIDIAAEREVNHYLGTPAMIMHSISSGAGGQTQYQMDYARTTNEKTEFLGDNLARTGMAKFQRNVRKTTVVAALEPPKVGSRGILGGKIVEEPKLVTDRYKGAQPRRQGTAAQRIAASARVPLFVPDVGFSGRKRRGTRVPVGIEMPATAYGTEVVALVGSGGVDIASLGNIYVRFEAYSIVEELGVYATSDITLPPEQLSFPPWYGEIWRSQRVGGLYSNFFGVGSIVDPTVVLGATTEPPADAEQAARTLYLDAESVFGAMDAMPPAGLSSTPESEGGESYGPALDTAVDQEGNERTIIGEIAGESPIAKAVNELVRIYGAVKANHYDAPSFVHNYTWRPIASLVDMFGTADLKISDDGVVLSGREGFHSRAFGDLDELRQLVSPTKSGMPQKVLGLQAKPNEVTGDKSDPSAEVAKRLDTRREKRLAVLRYLNALAASRGVVLG